MLGVVYGNSNNKKRAGLEYRHIFFNKKKRIGKEKKEKKQQLQSLCAIEMNSKFAE